MRRTWTVSPMRLSEEYGDTQALRAWLVTHVLNLRDLTLQSWCVCPYNESKEKKNNVSSSSVFFIVYI